MPIYEYECEHCAHRFEVIQKFSDAPIAVCPKCGGGPVQKLLSSPAIQFKGSGFYLTDYGRGTSSKPEGKSDSKSKGDKADSGGSSDSSSKSDSGGSGASGGSGGSSGGETKSSTSESSTPKAAPAKAD